MCAAQRRFCRLLRSACLRDRRRDLETDLEYPRFWNFLPVFSALAFFAFSLDLALSLNMLSLACVLLATILPGLCLSSLRLRERAAWVAFCFFCNAFRLA